MTIWFTERGCDVAVHITVAFETAAQRGRAQRLWDYLSLAYDMVSARP
jgi:hypothetical protein